MGLHNFTIRQLSEELGAIPFFGGASPGAILRSLDFFSDVDDAVLADVADDVMICEIPADTVICRHGKFDERFYLLLSGVVRAVIPTEDNPRFELFRLGPGDFFGEEIALSQSPRENSIIAITGVTALSLPPDALRRMIDASGTIRHLMNKRYIERDLRGDLRRVPLFTRLDDVLFGEALARVELIECTEGDTVFREGDTGDAFYLIREGKVEVYRTVDGGRRLIAILADGQYFGEMSLLADEKRNASVECRTKVSLVKLSRDAFRDIVKRDERVAAGIAAVYAERKKSREDVLHNPRSAYITRSLLDLNREINRHLDILSQCVIDTDRGGALLATLPGSRYPYVYPRDSACASRFLYAVITSTLKAGDTAFRLLGEIARFIVACQRADGYWGQRYGVQGEDKAIYRQEDNVAHGVAILCRYLLAAKRRGVTVPQADAMIDAIARGFEFSKKNYYRNEIHLYYSTTSIHESAIEEGYSIWVNYAYLCMLDLIEKMAGGYGVPEMFAGVRELAAGFRPTIEKIFTLSGRHVRRIRPDGEVDLRPDITLMSPFFFGSVSPDTSFAPSDELTKSIDYIEQTLWDPDLGMLQRYLPFIEDPHTHIHAGNGPWLQYTSILAQYYFCTGNIEKGNKILAIIDTYRSKEGYLCEHLTTPERFYEFKRLEWLSGKDFEKEFSPEILVAGITYDLIVEELNHMKKSYDEIERTCARIAENGHIAFATPLMWSHAEYAMALMLKSAAELGKINTTVD